MRFHFSSSCKNFLKPLDNAKQESAFFLMVSDGIWCDAMQKSGYFPEIMQIFEFINFASFDQRWHR